MPKQQQVINVVNHYAAESLLTSNKTELDKALEDGWEFKSIAPNIAVNNPYLFSPTLLGMSYILEKTEESGPHDGKS